MYSRYPQTYRPEQNIGQINGLDRSLGQQSNDRFLQTTKKRFATPNKMDVQCADPPNNYNTSSMNYSIFRGQSSSFQHQSPKFYGQHAPSSQVQSIPRINTEFQKTNRTLNMEFQNQSFGQKDESFYRQSLPQNGSFQGPGSIQSGGFEVQKTIPNIVLPTRILAHSLNQEWGYTTSNFSLASLPSTSKNNNNLGLLALPKPYKTTQFSSFNTQHTNRHQDESSQIVGSKLQKYGESEREKTFIFTGNVERILKWGKIFQNHFCYFEVIASVVSITDGKAQFEQIMLLRDKKGPILQVMYYHNATHIHIEDFHLGQILRAVGRITGPNIMSALTIRAATSQEIDSLTRLCYICDHGVSSFCGEMLH